MNEREFEDFFLSAWVETASVKVPGTKTPVTGPALLDLLRRAAEVEIGDQNRVVGQVRFGQSQIHGRERFPFRRRGAGHHHGMQRLQRLHVIQLSAQTSEFFARRLHGTMQIDQMRLRGRIEGMLLELG